MKAQRWRMMANAPDDSGGFERKPEPRRALAPEEARAEQR
jgi:hypothetical protein